MRIPMFQVDAFATDTFRGNPAAVCILKTWLEDDLLQSIAAENNVSETAFVARANGGYELRWFTPVVEVELCGHATLASAHVLFTEYAWDGSAISFNTRESGTLTVSRPETELTMLLPRTTLEDAALTDEICSATGLEPEDCQIAGPDLLLRLSDEATVRGVQPDFRALATLPYRGVIITAPGESCDFVSRFFAPRYGLPEDPVTGSAHCALTPYWAEALGRTELFAEQVSERGGALHCILGDVSVQIGGHAVTYLRGDIAV